MQILGYKMIISLRHLTLTKIIKKKKFVFLYKSKENIFSVQNKDVLSRDGSTCITL